MYSSTTAAAVKKGDLSLNFLVFEEITTTTVSICATLEEKARIGNREVGVVGR